MSLNIIKLLLKIKRAYITLLIQSRKFSVVIFNIFKCIIK